jgi:hypothetical protein
MMMKPKTRWLTLWLAFKVGLDVVVVVVVNSSISPTMSIPLPGAVIDFLDGGIVSCGSAHGAVN